MINFTAIILKFGQQGEKSGWWYIDINAGLAAALNPGIKKSFRVKGKLDAHEIRGVALLPMGEGHFIMALNAGIRKAIAKPIGATLQVQLSVDKQPYQLNPALVACLQDEPAAMQFFKSLPLAHQNYFSKWIEATKTTATQTKRIAMTVTAMCKKMNFPEMLKAGKNGVV